MNLRAGTHFGFLATPQPLPRIVSRAFVCCALVMRVQIDHHPEHGDAADLLGSVRGWLETSGCDAELEPGERASLDHPLGRLDPGEIDRYGWYGEAAAVLAWSVQRFDLPGIGRAVDALEVAGALDWLTEQGAMLRTGARLRPREQLSALLEVVGAADWRLKQVAVAPQPVSMTRWSSGGMQWPPDVARFDLVDDDLAIGGRPVTQVDARKLLNAARAVRERHRAALWLLGQASAYSDVALPE
jgi:hypothetical protein